MKKLMIATAAGVVAAGAFAEAEVWNLTFNAKCLVPSYTKAGEVDYYKQGSVKYTAMQVNGDTYAWDSKNYYGDANLGADTGTFGKKDEKVWADVAFDVDGNFFLCAGFGTEKSVSGSFTGNMADGTPAYGTWSVKVNASAAKKLDANPDLTLTDLVKLPKAVLESKKDWDALQDAIDSQIKGATTLEQLKTIAEAGVAEAEAEMLDVTNKIAALEKEIAGLAKARADYEAEWNKMTAALKDTTAIGEDYELSDAAKKAVDDAKGLYDKDNAQLKTFKDELEKLEKSLVEISKTTSKDLFPAAGEVQKDGSIKSQYTLWQDAIAATNKLVDAMKNTVAEQVKGVDTAKKNWDDAVAVTNGVWEYFAKLSGKALSKDYNAKAQFADADAAKTKSLKEQQDAINAYSAPVSFSDNMLLATAWGTVNGRTIINLGGSLTEAKLMLDGSNWANVYELVGKFFEVYTIDGAKKEVADAKGFVTAVENAIKAVKAAPEAEQAKREEEWVRSLKTTYLD